MECEFDTPCAQDVDRVRWCVPCLTDLIERQNDLNERLNDHVERLEAENGRLRAWRRNATRALLLARQGLTDGSMLADDIDALRLPGTPGGVPLHHKDLA